jgi:hypothetical protein
MDACPSYAIADFAAVEYIYTLHTLKLVHLIEAFTLFNQSLLNLDIAFFATSESGQ